MKRSLISNILLSLVSVFFVLFCAEIIMRFTWEMGGWVKRPIYRKSSNPYLRYELIPGAKSGGISINSDGFRGREYSIAKPDGTLRIIMLGDSETFSFMLPEDDSLPKQLENLLNKKFHFLRYEVLNFGVEGYSTFQELEMFKTKGIKYNPDLVILNYVLNDPEPGEYYFNKTFLMRHSALVRYFTYRFKKALIIRERKRLNIRTEVDNYYYYHQPKYFIPLKNAILEMADMVQQNGQKLVIVIFPTSSIAVKDFKENYPYWPLHKLVKSIGSGNIIFIDLIDEFNRLGMTPQSVSINYAYDESHKNARALGVSAQYIYEALRARGLIPENDKALY
ncbi:MAG: hypothetical protein PHC54_04560 [Candidatus Omnitrophica bacterium]|nr:hypothetical protein [Candidatus Omnitrophota bacterium]MDD5593052.1 hypothetical protein [Candidatus Omnitrophota bacterium]